MQKIKDNLGLIFISLVTILYLWLACNLVINIEDVKALDLNEKGDFLAGVFSPLAFLWLVYGYLQQGQELKQNTSTLKLQYQELSNSVEQQRLLAELTKSELDLANKKENRQNYLDTIQAQPFFHFDEFHIFAFANNPDGTSNGMLSLECEVKNSRAICRQIDFVINTPNRNVTSTTREKYLNNTLSESVKLQLFLPFGYEFENRDSFEVDVEVYYLDAYDNEQFQIIEFKISKDYSNGKLEYDFDYSIKSKSY